MKKIKQKDLLDLDLRNTHVSSKKIVKKSILAIDYGEKYCGLAHCFDGVTVIPLGIITTSQFWTGVETVLTKKQIELVVLGLPVGINREENHVCEQIRSVSKKVTNKFNVKVAFVNERYSSKNTLTKNKKERLDDLAALNILQYYLDKKSEDL